MKFEKILDEFSFKFDLLELFFEGNSRILKLIPGYEDLLIMKLKPTVFSFKNSGIVELEGIDIIRTKLNQIFCKHLTDNGVKTSTLFTKGEFTIIKKEIVPPIEVVVKGSLIGSPKHIYADIDKHKTRFGDFLQIGKQHNPYVRFDYRNILPKEDMCMPTGLADYFIDTKMAEFTALKAFDLLKKYLNKYYFDLLDICYFMNQDGDTITAEISTDDTNIVYIGDDINIQAIFQNRDKDNVINKGNIILEKLIK